SSSAPTFYSSSLCCLCLTLAPILFSFSLIIRLTPISTLFPYTTLFRSRFNLTSGIWEDQNPPTPRKSTRPGRKSLQARTRQGPLDRKSTRLNSSHGSISYAVFCLKKKRVIQNTF